MFEQPTVSDVVQYASHEVSKLIKLDTPIERGSNTEEAFRIKEETSPFADTAAEFIYCILNSRSGSFKEALI